MPAPNEITPAQLARLRHACIDSPVDHPAHDGAYDHIDNLIGVHGLPRSAVAFHADYTDKCVKLWAMFPFWQKSTIDRHASRRAASHARICRLTGRPQ